MTARAVLALAIIALLALGAAFALGWQQHSTRTDRALRSAQHETDSLRLALATNVATVVHDTARIDSIVTRWRRRVDTLPGRVDTLPGRVDTVPLLRFADSVITTLDSSRRQCVAVLNDCASTAAALTRRATQAEARIAVLEGTQQARDRWRTAERIVCATSLATNFIQWRAYR
ncbi:MAG: hypothetical protein K2R93_12420 [Gemmatimonadaceae bacterium]|nr:hypothetical protein [Gemmatimonadaceae bacterium]